MISMCYYLLQILLPELHSRGAALLQELSGQSQRRKVSMFASALAAVEIPVLFQAGPFAAWHMQLPSLWAGTSMFCML